LVIATLLNITEAFPQSLIEKYYGNIDDLTKFSLNDGPKKTVLSETRNQANFLIDTLSNIASNPKAEKYVKKTFKAGNCIKTVEEAIAAIETGTLVIEGAEGGISQLISNVRKMNEKTDIVEATKDAAKVLRQLETLIPELAPGAKPGICGSTFDVVSNSLRAVGDVLNEISEDKSLGLSKITVFELKISGEIVVSVNAFLRKLRKNFASLQMSCSSDKEYNTRSLTAIERMLEDLAVLFKDLGDEEEGKKISEKTDLIRKIIGAVGKYSGSDIGKLRCNETGSFETTARMMEDLVELIQEVGLENLKEQLGVEGIF